MGEVTWTLCLQLYKDLQNDVLGIGHRIKNVDWVDFTDFYKSIDPGRRISDIHAVKTVMEKIQHLKGFTMAGWLHESSISDSYEILCSVLEDVKIDELNISMDNVLDIMPGLRTVVTLIHGWINSDNVQDRMDYLARFCEICQVKKVCARNCRLHSDQLLMFIKSANDTEIVEMDIDGNPYVSDDVKDKLQMFLARNRSKAKSFMVEDITATVKNVAVRRSNCAFYESHLSDPATYHINEHRLKGKVLIINNEFKGAAGGRVGSLLDLWNQDVLWTELGFEIEIRRNLTAIDMREACNEFARSVAGISIVIVIIMTHGGHSDGQGCLVGENGQFISTDDIITMFDSSNSPHLHGIPKLFLFHTCGNSRAERGSSRYGPSSSDMLTPYSSQFGHVSRRHMMEGSWFMNALTNGLQGRPYDTGALSMGSDMLIFHSSQIGSASCGHTKNGSWLMNAIANVFQQHAHDTDVLSMMVMVNAALSAKKADGSIQMSNQQTYLRKKLYLFPGWPAQGSRNKHRVRKPFSI